MEENIYLAGDFLNSALKNITLLSCFLGLVFSCGDPNQSSMKEKDVLPFLEIDDTHLKEIIKEFTKVNNLKGEEDYLAISIHNSADREIFYLEHDKYSYETLRPPSFFSKIDNFSVLIFVNLGSSLESSSWDIAKNTLALNGLTIDENTTGFLYDPTLWKLVRCGDGPFEVDNNIQLIEFCVPCGRRIDFGSKRVVFDSSVVVNSISK